MKNSYQIDDQAGLMRRLPDDFELRRDAWRVIYFVLGVALGLAWPIAQKIFA